MILIVHYLMCLFYSSLLLLYDRIEIEIEIGCFYVGRFYKLISYLIDRQMVKS